MPPLLSILTPAIPARLNQLDNLMETIALQITEPGTVEHLALIDNKARSVGLKRQALLNAARGKYIAFVDDDDTISHDYIARLLEACETGADVITFQQQAIINGASGIIDFQARAGLTDAPWQEGKTVERPPWHVCAWRRELIAHCLFTDKNYGEDIDWCLQARSLIRTSVHIPKVLHIYRHDAALTAAPAPV